jgi:hypothetical protein
MNFAFDGDVVLGQARPPFVQCIAGDGEGQMKRAVAVVRRDDATAGRFAGLRGRALRGTARAHGRATRHALETVVAVHALEAEYAFIEGDSAFISLTYSAVSKMPVMAGIVPRSVFVSRDAT